MKRQSAGYPARRIGLIFDMVSIQKFSFKETAMTLGYTVRQLRSRHQAVVAMILNNLKEQGISSIEDLL